MFAIWSAAETEVRKRPSDSFRVKSLLYVGGNESIAEVRVPDYKTVWGLDLISYTMHCRFTLIDTVTGYRGDSIEGKFTVEI